MYRRAAPIQALRLCVLYAIEVVMSKRFIASVNYMRGLCMLGVIAIHVGSAALSNPTPNLVLIGILEILSRFSVPSFFFLSAFGMFYSQPLHKPFSYGVYLKRRLRTVLVPYVFWSCFYLVYSAVLSHNWTVLQPAAILKAIWYGNAMYHIYFLVILLWFYFFMPLWRKLLTHMLKAPLPSFILLFAGNMIFNFYSSYIWTYIGPNEWLRDAFTYRLNWVVLHYLFIFMFGAFVAEKFDSVITWIGSHGTWVNLFQLIAAAVMIASYAGVMKYLGYDALAAVYTVHQLSPAGMVYTLSTIIFLLYHWECRRVSVFTDKAFTALGNLSYPIYLVHPVFLGMCTGLAAHAGVPMRAVIIICTYIFVTAASSVYAAAVARLPLPKWLSVCLQGK